MERGTVSEQREPDGTERYAELELLRLALPRRVFTLSQIKYCADRVKWLYDNRNLIGGLDSLDAGEITAQEYQSFVNRQVMVGKRWADVQQTLETARRLGAQKARATLSKSEEDLVATEEALAEVKAFGASL